MSADSRIKTSHISPKRIAAALKFIGEHGSLVEFPCPDSEVPLFFAAMQEGKMVKREKKGVRFSLTPAGSAYIEVVNGR